MQTNLRIWEDLRAEDAWKLRYNLPVGRIVQLVRTPLLHRGGRRFESYSAHRQIPSNGEICLIGWEAIVKGIGVVTNHEIDRENKNFHIRFYKKTTRNEYIFPG